MDKKVILNETLIKFTLLDLNHTCVAHLRVEKKDYSKALGEIVQAFAEIEIIRAMNGTPDMASHEIKIKALSEKAERHKLEVFKLETRLEAIKKVEAKPGGVINAINAFPD